MARSLYPIKLYIKQPVIAIMMGLTLAINIFMWLWLFLRIGPQTGPIFLHYNILFGVDMIGEWWRILYIPITALSIFIVNFILGWVFFNKDKFVAYILNFIALLCQVFLLVATFLLVFLNV
jgi:hypothetical protein